MNINKTKNTVCCTVCLGVKKCIAVPIINFKLATGNLWQLHKLAMKKALQVHNRVLYSNIKQNIYTILNLILQLTLIIIIV